MAEWRRRQFATASRPWIRCVLFNVFVYLALFLHFVHIFSVRPFCHSTRTRTHRMRNACVNAAQAVSERWGEKTKQQKFCVRYCMGYGRREWVSCEINAFCSWVRDRTTRRHVWPNILMRRREWKRTEELERGIEQSQLVESVKGRRRVGKGEKVEGERWR